MVKTKKKKEIKKEKELKLDLGCGPHPIEGFTGVDSMDFGQPIKADLTKKWKWKDNSVDEVNCSHTIEHFTNKERIHVFNELYRVMKVGAKCTITVPHWASIRAYGDLTHEWPPISEFFWYYLSKDWRKTNAPHTPLTCNFTATWGYSMHPLWQTKNQETQQFGLTHYREVAQDTIATIIKV